MTEQLIPPPPQEMVSSIRSKLLSLGVNEIEHVPQDILAAIAGAALSWFYTPTGADMFNSMFAMKQRRGDTRKRYFVRDGYNNPHEVKPEDVVWFYTLFVKGRPVDPAYLDEVEKPVIFCDHCGMGGWCPKEIIDRSTGKTEHICNHCLCNNPNLKDLGDTKLCDQCDALKCDYHPSKISSYRRVV